MNTNQEQQIGAYVNSLTPTTTLSLASGNSKNSPSRIPSAEEASSCLQWIFERPNLFIAILGEKDMRRQADELNRSVTIIIWYKVSMRTLPCVPKSLEGFGVWCFLWQLQANTDPIRLQQMLPTFPYFQLSRFSTLIADLGLTPSSYLDTYIPLSRQWEQHTISSVRVVETRQRLLYRLRRSLIDGLSEDECISFQEEIQMQTSYDLRSQIPAANGSTSSPSSPNKQQPQIIITNRGMQSHSPLKRTTPSGDIQESGHSSKVHIPNSYYVPNSGASAVASETTNPGAGPSPSDASSSVADPQSNDQDSNVYVYQPVFYGQAPTNASSDATPLPQYLLTTAAPPIPYHPHPPLKRWPNDYTVSEISNGFNAMDALISRSSGNSNMTQRAAFERVFGSRYVKSTVCRHRTIWRKAHQTLREQFESMGADDRACWGEFVRRVEGRPPGKNAGPDVVPQTNTLQYQTPTNGEDVQDPGINSTQNQGLYFIFRLWV